jgi:osmotically-inducible protein OsmY
MRSIFRWRTAGRLQGRQAFVAAALLLSLCGCVFHRHKQVGASMLDDKVTTDRIEAAFRANDPKELQAVQVRTSGGVVTLSGVVGTEGARERAVQLATSVHRATRVEDQIQVRH